jgi:hypothetical protein
MNPAAWFTLSGVEFRLARPSCQGEPVRIELGGRRPLTRRITPVDHQDHPEELVLDARRLTFASPLDLAAMVTLAHSAGARGAKTTLMAPESSDAACYLERMNVFASLPAGSRVVGIVPVQTRADRADVLVEVLPVLGTTAQSLVHRVGSVALGHLDAPAGRLAFQSIGELIDNAISHGVSDIGAFAAAQAYTGKTTGRRGVEFAICDTGIGVLDHLRRNPRYRDLENERVALVQALRRGVTGTADRRGNGLADLFKVTEAAGYTRLVLRSGRGLASVVARQHDLRQRDVEAADRITGTWAWLRVRYP